jgi:GTP1/Obg family GTP-binding protein
MSNEANAFAISEIARLTKQLSNLQKFYDSIQQTMNEHKEYRNLLEDIDQATEEYHNNN